MIEVDYVLNVRGGKTTISAEDLPLFLAAKWRLDSCGYVAGAYPKGHRGVAYFHRVVMGYPEEVDHINHDRSDNRRSNLRAVSHAENCQNRKGARRDSARKFRGVRPNGKGFQACARVNYKLHLLGTYPTMEEAHAVVSEWRARNMPGSQERIALEARSDD